MAVPSVVYDRNQICEQVKAITGRSLREEDSFYKWLDATLTRSKPLYDLRELKKFLFVGFYLYIKRNFCAARQCLANDLTVNKCLYSDTVSIDEFISYHSIIRIAQVKRSRSQASKNITPRVHQRIRYAQAPESVPA